MPAATDPRREAASPQPPLQAAAALQAQTGCCQVVMSTAASCRCSAAARASWCWAAFKRRRQYFMRMLAGVIFPLRGRKSIWGQLLNA